MATLSIYLLYFSVGKTSLLKQYVEKKFSGKYQATIGADFLSKDIVVNDQILMLQIWDTAGQEQYQTVQSIFYRGADGCIIVYDITNPSTFANIGKWRDKFFNYVGLESTENFPMIIIGNKADLVSDRKVSKERVTQWCKENGNLDIYEASAKTADYVDEAFMNIGKKAIEKQKGRL